MSDKMECPAPERVLRGLKDFQRDTAEYVFQRLYMDEDPAYRFLIADEVGLGKTLVARGIIAKAVNHLWDKVNRIDVVYVCSNADIARQNINRLSILSQDTLPLASRITLLPKVMKNLQNNKLNFVSFTPGTSFELKTSLGVVEERVLLCRLLKRAWRLRGTGYLNVLQGNVKRTENFRWLVEESEDERLDESLVEAFVEALKTREHDGGTENIRTRFEALCDKFGRSRKHIPDEEAEERTVMVGEIRGLLARTCLKSLEPDLIILDEFQRFRHLLDGQDEASELARDLFQYPNARVLLLSATPYKMYTLDEEAGDDDHYKDFVRTLRFLQPDAGEATAFERNLKGYRRELLRFMDGGKERLPAIKVDLESRLRRVMVRTERLAVTGNRDGMLVEVPPRGLTLEAGDLEGYVALQKIARVLDQSDTLEYWKSAPYLLNFMDEYEFKKEFLEALEDPERRAMIRECLPAIAGSLLKWDDIRAYARIDPANARLRALHADTIGAETWRLLWVPPSLPYYRLEGAFGEPGLASFTKRLVFSSWRVVPKVIAALLSYDAERHMVRSFDKKVQNTVAARKSRKPLLRFARQEGRLTGMPVLALIYPSLWLARECDPLRLMPGMGENGDIPVLHEIVEEARRRIEARLPAIGATPTDKGAEDDRWYWAAPILLDRETYPRETVAWFKQDHLADVWRGPTDEQDPEEEEDAESHWDAHVKEAKKMLDAPLVLGRPPADLPLVLAHMALAGPGTVALRALSRVSGGDEAMKAVPIRNSAAQVGWHLRRLWDYPETISLLRGMNPEEPYWRRVLEYAAAGCLQSALDEYAHVLLESEGLTEKTPEAIAAGVAETISEALGLRTSTLSADAFRIDTAGNVMHDEAHGMRARFAQRFGEEKDEAGKEVTRRDQVRTAFNSPFWPFVLATTSVGQEGLDFHPYCHAVVHWNLPTNPVDLEQREGRVHRYKGHAVRRNLARKHRAMVDQDNGSDPWALLFAQAVRERDAGASDLIPFWVYPIDGGARIERHVPALPLSRDLQRMEALRRSLVVYRMVFGQPRQEDLITYLLTRLSETEVALLAEWLRIDLSPPKLRSGGKVQVNRRIIEDGAHSWTNEPSQRGQFAHDRSKCPE